MSPLEPTPKFYITSNSDYHFQVELEGDRVLNIYLKIIKSDEIWKVESRTTLADLWSEKVLKEVKNNLELENHVSRWIGSWDYMFLKPACVNLAGKIGIDDDVISKPDNITREELGIFRDQKLLEISGRSLGLVIESGYLDEVSGKQKTTSFPIELYPAYKEKFEPDEKENQSEKK
jgi:hypothetical protein